MGNFLTFFKKKLINNKKQIIMKLSKNQVEGIVRHILTGVGGVLIALGVLEEAILTEAIGIATTVTGVIWSIIDKNKGNKEA